MKIRTGFVANSSSQDFYFSSRHDEESDPIHWEQEVKYGKKDCNHFFVGRNDYPENDDITPAVCLICGAFVDGDLIIEDRDTDFDRYDFEQEISGAEYSYFENPYAKEKFADGFSIDTNLKDEIIL